jgi:hypothetical protein
MKYVKLYLFKRKAGLLKVKHRKKIRTLKAVIGVSLYSYLKFVLLIDVDALFILLGWWWLQEIKWR